MNAVNHADSSISGMIKSLNSTKSGDVSTTAPATHRRVMLMGKVSSFSFILQL